MDDRIIIGGWINTASPIVAEIMSAADFDFLVVDAEHSAVDIHQAQLLFQAIKAGNPKCKPMVRLPGNTYAETKRYLDAGAMGVIAPLINKKEDALELLRSVKFPPLGERGVGYGRSHGYGFEFDEYMKTANENIFVCVQIEHARAVENIDDIFSVAGIDAAIVGPYDLSASLGITSQFDHPSYLKALKTVLDKCEEYGILPGIHVVQPSPNEVLSKIKQGYRMIGYSLDITMIGDTCRKGLDQIRKGLGDDS